MRRAAGTALGGGLLLLVAFMFDAGPLFVAGSAFALLGAGTAAWVTLSARGASIERTLEADRVIEDEPLEATLELSRGAIGLPGGEVLDPLAREPVPLDGALSLLSSARAARITVITRFERRGRLELEPPSLVVHDGLRLACSMRGGGRRHHVLVLPRTEPVEWVRRSQVGRTATGTGRAQFEPMAAVDVDGLRPYRQGTPASRIHWPALARGAGLLERQLQADGENRPLVILDARGNGSAEHLDAAVRAAASLVLELARIGGCGLLLPGARRATAIEPDLAGWPAAHARLALVEGGPGTPAPVLGGGDRLGAMLYVTAQPLGRLPAALGAGHGGRRVLVLPKECSAQIRGTPSFEVAGCYGFVLRAEGRTSRESRAGRATRQARERAA